MPNKRRFFAALLTALSLVSAPAFADVAVTIRRSKPVDAAPLSPTGVAR